MFRIVSPLIAFSDQWTMWTHLLRHWFRWDLVGISLGSFDFCPSVSMPGAELWWSTGWHCWERSCTFLCSENMSMFLFRFCSDRLNMFKQTFRWLYDWCDDLIHSLIHLSSIFPEILPARPRKACSQERFDGQLEHVGTYQQTKLFTWLTLTYLACSSCSAGLCDTL